MRSWLSVAAMGALTIVTLPSPPVHAAGCGGYVNVFVSGCAPWDNNPRRMPGAPGYLAPRTGGPAMLPQTRMVQPPTGNRFISTNGSTLIGNDSAGLRGRSGVIARDGASLGGSAGGSMRR